MCSSDLGMLAGRYLANWLSGAGLQKAFGSLAFAVAFFMALGAS